MKGPEKVSSKNNGFAIFHHGGTFVEGPPCVYEGGERRIFPLNSDLLTPLWVMDVVEKQLKYLEVELKNVYYLQHGAALPKGLRTIIDGNNTREMWKIVDS